MQIAPGIHHFDTGPFNWYLIEESGRLTLVDAGFPGHYRVFEEGLRSLGRQPRDVEAILLTHAHADHTGFAQRARRASGAPVRVHRADVAKAGRILQLPWIGLLSRAWRPATAAMLGRAVLNGVFTLPTVPGAKGFDDGETLDVPGRPHALHVPGHTPGESAFYLPERQVLISGDALITRDLFSGEAGEPQLPHPALSVDDAQARRSLDRLRELGTVTMLPGHGRPWRGDLAAAVDRARKAGRRPRV